MAINLGDMRKPYHDASTVFDIPNLASREPYGQFKAWFDEAKSHMAIEEANAMCLATATKDGIPSARTILLKAFHEPIKSDATSTRKPGFIFFTNYESRKGVELAENPVAAMNFYWEALKKSVRIEGRVEKISQELSEQYFDSRPVGSQIGAMASQQSAVIAGRHVIRDKEAELKKMYEDTGKKVPKPDYWGGYRIVPHMMEFWQGQSTRLHDRILFRRPRENEVIDQSITAKGDDGWLIERLSP